MLQVDWPVILVIQFTHLSTKFATGVKIKAKGELELSLSHHLLKYTVSRPRQFGVECW